MIIFEWNLKKLLWFDEEKPKLYIEEEVKCTHHQCIVFKNHQLSVNNMLCMRGKMRWDETKSVDKKKKKNAKYMDAKIGESVTQVKCALV